jgi:hypothetical protein
VTSLLGDASDALADARIAVRTEDVNGMRDSLDQLLRVADEMEQVSEGLT